MMSLSSCRCWRTTGRLVDSRARQSLPPARRWPPAARGKGSAVRCRRGRPADPPAATRRHRGGVPRRASVGLKDRRLPSRKRFGYPDVAGLNPGLLVDDHDRPYSGTLATVVESEQGPEGSWSGRTRPAVEPRYLRLRSTAPRRGAGVAPSAVLSRAVASGQPSQAAEANVENPSGGPLGLLPLVLMGTGGGPSPSGGAACAVDVNAGPHRHCRCSRLRDRATNPSAGIRAPVGFRAPRGGSDDDLVSRYPRHRAAGAGRSARSRCSERTLPSLRHGRTRRRGLDGRQGRSR